MKIGKPTARRPGTKMNPARSSWRIDQGERVLGWVRDRRLEPAMVGVKPSERWMPEVDTILNVAGRRLGYRRPLPAVGTLGAAIAAIRAEIEQAVRRLVALGPRTT